MAKMVQVSLVIWWIHFAAIYPMMIMILAAVSLALTVIIMNIHHHPPNRPVPGWLISLVFGCIAPMVCFSCHKPNRKCRSTSTVSVKSEKSHDEMQLSKNEEWRDLLSIIERLLFFLFLVTGIILFLFFSI